MLAGDVSGYKVWAVGGQMVDLTYPSDTNHVHTIDLSNGQVTLLPPQPPAPLSRVEFVSNHSEQVFNKNISEGCTVMVDDRFLYVIGGEGKLVIYCVFKL